MVRWRGGGFEKENKKSGRECGEVNCIGEVEEEEKIVRL